MDKNDEDLISDLLLQAIEEIEPFPVDPKEELEEKWGRLEWSPDNE